MNYIRPIKRAINENEILEWNDSYMSHQERYNNFVSIMEERGYSKNEIADFWRNNFGEDVPEKPSSMYYCYVMANNLKLIFTVAKREEFGSGEREFQVVKHNAAVIDKCNSKRKVAIKNSKLTVTDEDLNISINEQKKKAKELGEQIYSLDYANGNWFTNMAVYDIVNKVNIKLVKEGAIFFGYDHMESYNFEITDKTFKDKLYDLINEKFKEIESELI